LDALGGEKFLSNEESISAVIMELRKRKMFKTL